MIQAEVKGIELTLETAPTLFSPRHIDRGTLALLSIIDFGAGDKVLDLGCGYGVVGIVAGKLIGAENVTMTDVDEVAVQIATKNAVANDVPDIDVKVSDGYAQVDDKNFTKIISHPPYHVDFSVPKMFIEKGFHRLAVGGQLYMVTKRKEWYKNKLIAIFGGVRIWEIDEYYVFMAIKKSASFANLQRKAQKRQNDTSTTTKKNLSKKKR